jgi:hypothetical protein
VETRFLDPELLALERRLNFTAAREYGELRLCGALRDATTSCMLVRGHIGAHAWQSHDGATLVRW